MIYKVYCDEKLIFDSRIQELALIEPIATLGQNKAGSFSFTMPPTHEYYDAIKKKKSILKIIRDENTIFSGMATEVSEDFHRNKKYYCEGELSYLNDSIQRQKHYKNYSVRGLLEAYLNVHNEQVEPTKRFKLGIVTVKDSNDSITCYTNMENTLQCLKTDLLDDLGGFFRVRREMDGNYLDYLAESPHTSGQIIKLGENLKDFKSNIDTSEIATAIIPLGATQETPEVIGLDKKLDIKSVNDGLDYVSNDAAISEMGWICKTVDFPNVTSAENLKKKGERYLKETQFEKVWIEAQAIDLSMLDDSEDTFILNDSIRVVSAPHGLDKYFMLTKQVLHLAAPQNDTITLGKEEKTGISAKASKASEEIKKAIAAIVPTSTIIQHAVSNASQLIAEAMGGFVYKTQNELYIMDSADPKAAQNVWRWNINGLGYSNTGINGEYGLAMTMDGRIVADYITSGTMNADRIKGGTLEMGGKDDKNGVIEIKDASGKTLVKLDSKGMTLDSSVKINFGNIEGADGFVNEEGLNERLESYATSDDVTEITNETLKTSNVVAKNLHVAAANVDGTLTAEKVQGGTFAVGGSNDKNGVIEVFDADGNIIARLDKDGLTVSQGIINGLIVNGGTVNGATVSGGSLKSENVDKDFIRISDGCIYGGENGKDYASIKMGKTAKGESGLLKIKSSFVIFDALSVNLPTNATIGYIQIATKNDLLNYASTSTLLEYAKTTDLASYAKTTDLASYAKTTDLSSYVKTTELMNYYSKIDSDNKFQTKLTGYSGTINYVKSASLSWDKNSVTVTTGSMTFSNGVLTSAY